jgi:hypothetical protein
MDSKTKKTRGLRLLTRMKGNPNLTGKNKASTETLRRRFYTGP